MKVNSIGVRFQCGRDSRDDVLLVGQSVPGTVAVRRRSPVWNDGPRKEVRVCSILEPLLFLSSLIRTAMCAQFTAHDIHVVNVNYDVNPWANI